jgi:SAM-dependent methyltransferase
VEATGTDEIRVVENNDDATEAWSGVLFDRFVEYRDLIVTGLEQHGKRAMQMHPPAKGDRVLDVGCGFGEFLKIYAALGNQVTGTEIVPEFVNRLRKAGFDCRSGEVHTLDFDGLRFDAIILRAVFYRTLDAAATMRKVKSLLTPGGEIVLVDPCPGGDGAEYFFRKQFPQGQFYIVDRDRYFAMLRQRFDLACASARLIYGRPNAPLKPLSPLGHVWGLMELVAANLLHRKPYVLSYRLTAPDVF